MSTFHVICCHVIMLYHVLSCHCALSWIVMSSSYHGLYCHIIIPCHVLSCHHTMSCIVMSSYHVMYCDAIMTCHVIIQCIVITPCHDQGSTRGWGTTTPGARALPCTTTCRCLSAKCSPPPQPPGRRLDLSHHNDCSHAHRPEIYFYLFI